MLMNVTRKNLANIGGTQFGAHPVSHHKSLEVCISEPRLYKLIFSSKLPSANDIKHWVFEDILPCLLAVVVITVSTGVAWCSSSDIPI